MVPQWRTHTPHGITCQNNQNAMVPSSDTKWRCSIGAAPKSSRLSWWCSRKNLKSRSIGVAFSPSMSSTECSWRRRNERQHMPLLQQKSRAMGPGAKHGETEPKRWQSGVHHNWAGTEHQWQQTSRAMRMWLIRMWLGKSLTLVRHVAGLYLSKEDVYYVALHVIGWVFRLYCFILCLI